MYCRSWNLSFSMHMCGRLFYSKEALEHHEREYHVEGKKQWHCRHCNKVFQRDGNKILHERNCQHGAGPSRKRPLQQQTLEEFVIKKIKGMESEVITQQGGSDEHPEYWKAPELKESSLKRTAMVYRKSFDEANKRELLERLKNALEQHKQIIRGMVSHAKNAVKWYISLNLHFCKAADATVKTAPSVIFRSEVFRSILTQNLEDMFEAGYN